MTRKKGDLYTVMTYVPLHMYQSMTKLKKIKFPSAHKQWKSGMVKEALEEYIAKYLPPAPVK